MNPWLEAVLIGVACGALIGLNNALVIIVASLKW